MNVKSPDSRPVRVLVSGFGPFPGVPVNPAERLVDTLSQRFTGNAAITFHAQILPTHYSGAYEILKKVADDFAPDLIIAFGVGAKTSGFGIETIARNKHGTRKDYSGNRQPSGPVIPDAPQTLRTSLPYKAIRDTLVKNSIPARLSKSAGAYVCNDLFYRLMHDFAAAAPQIMAGFVHIPFSEEYAPTYTGKKTLHPLPEKTLADGAALLVETAAAVWRKKRALTPS